MDNNSGDIYSKEQSRDNSPWKSGRHRKPLVDPDKPDEKSRAAKAQREHGHSSSRRKQLKQHRRRRLLITLGLLIMLIYIGYTGIVALKGAMNYKGIEAGDIDFRKMLHLGRQKAEVVALPASATDGEAELGDFDAEAMIETLDRSRSLETDVRNLLGRGLVDHALKRVEENGGGLKLSLDLRELLADAYLQEKRYSEAADWLVSNLELRPGDVEWRLHLAQALSGLEQHQAAIEIASWALRADSGSDQAHLVLAESYEALGMTTESIEEYSKIIAGNPDNHEVRSRLAMAYYEDGQYGRAVSLLNELVAAGTDNSLAYYNLAICYAKQSLVDETVATLLQASRKFGSKFVRAWILAKDFDTVRAETKFVLFANEISAGPDVSQMRASERKAQKDLNMGGSPFKLDDRSNTLLNRDR
jgi:tetratricopeptide (TPR) repeat protein